MHQFELAGCVTEHSYEQSIPPECSMQSMELHLEMLGCFGLINAIKRGEKMNCDGCSENKVNYEATMKRIQMRKEERIRRVQD